MNFLSLEYFLAVAAEKNFTTAASKLYVSQQSLSEHIKKLEAEVGTPLLIRKRPLELTEAGEIFAKGAETILDAKAQMLQEISSKLEQNEQRLKLAISPFEAPPLLPGLITYFKRQYPAVDVEVVKRQKDTLPEEIDDISFYFDFPPLNTEMDQIFFIKNDPYVMVCRQSLLQKTYPDTWESRLAELRKTGDLSIVQALPFLVLKGRSGKLSQFALELFHSFHFDPVIGFRSDNGELNSTVCLQGAGAAVGSFFYERSRYMNELTQQDDPLLLIPLRTKRGTIPIAVSYRRGKRFSAVESYFLDAARAFLKEHNSQFSGTAYAAECFSPDLFY